MSDACSKCGREGLSFDEYRMLEEYRRKKKKERAVSRRIALGTVPPKLYVGVELEKGSGMVETYTFLHPDTLRSFALGYEHMKLGVYGILGLLRRKR